jgi:hypothetical protein
VLVLLLYVLRPYAGRIFVGVFFLVMVVGVNVVLVLVAPDQFVALGTAAPVLPPYEWFFANFVALAPHLFGLLAAAYETAVALLMLSNGRYPKWGLLGGHRLPPGDHAAWRVDPWQPDHGGSPGVPTHQGVRQEPPADAGYRAELSARWRGALCPQKSVTDHAF